MPESDFICLERISDSSYEGRYLQMLLEDINEPTTRLNLTHFWNKYHSRTPTDASFQIHSLPSKQQDSNICFISSKAVLSGKGTTSPRAGVWKRGNAVWRIFILFGNSLQNPNCIFKLYKCNNIVTLISANGMH